MLRQIEWRVENGPIRNRGEFPVNTFCKRKSFIWQWFFPVSILKKPRKLKKIKIKRTFRTKPLAWFGFFKNEKSVCWYPIKVITSLLVDKMKWKCQHIHTALQNQRKMSTYNWWLSKFKQQQCYYRSSCL